VQRYSSDFRELVEKFEIPLPKKETLIQGQYHSLGAQPSVQSDISGGRIFFVTWTGEEGGCETEGRNGDIRLYIFRNGKLERPITLLKNYAWGNLVWKFSLPRYEIVFYDQEKNRYNHLILHNRKIEKLFTLKRFGQILQMDCGFWYDTLYHTKGDSLYKTIYSYKEKKSTTSFLSSNKMGDFSSAKDSFTVLITFFPKSKVKLVTPSGVIGSNSYTINNSHTAWQSDQTFWLLSADTLRLLSTSLDELQAYPMKQPFIFETLENGVLLSHDDPNEGNFTFLTVEGTQTPVAINGNYYNVVGVNSLLLPMPE